MLNSKRYKKAELNLTMPAVQPRDLEAYFPCGLGTKKTVFKAPITKANPMVMLL